MLLSICYTCSEICSFHVILSLCYVNALQPLLLLVLCIYSVIAELISKLSTISFAEGCPLGKRVEGIRHSVLCPINAPLVIVIAIIIIVGWHCASSAEF